MTVVMIAVGVLAAVTWLVLVVRTIRQVLAEVADPTVCGLWIVLVLVAPFVGPLAWALVRARGTPLSGRV